MALKDLRGHGLPQRGHGWPHGAAGCLQGSRVADDLVSLQMDSGIVGGLLVLW